MKSSCKNDWQPVIQTGLLGVICGLVLFAGTQTARPLVIGVSKQIDVRGHDVFADSFDSADPAHSINGLYPFIQTMQKDNGDIAAGLGITNSLTGGGAWIKGHVTTGTNGVITIGTNGSVGDKAWVEGDNMGIQPSTK